MDCKVARKLFEAFLLDELDVETRNQLDNHVTSCQNCRKELERSQDAIDQLRKVEQIETSQIRREQVLKAMQDAYKEKIERLIKAVERRPVYRPAIAAAVFLAIICLIVGYLISISHTSKYALKITDIDGKALSGSLTTDEWKGISSGDVVREGRILTSATSVVCAEVLNLDSLKKEGTVYLNQNTSLTLRSGAKGISILLDSGDIFVDLDNQLQIDLVTPAGDRFQVKDASQFEASLRDTISLKASVPDESMRSEAKDILFEGERLSHVVQKISAILGIKLGLASEIVGEKRVYFYGDSKDPQLFDKFERAMQMQGIVLVRHEDSYKVNIAEPARGQFLKRLFVRIARGSGRLVGEHGTIELAQGKEGFVDPDGYPNLLALASHDIASWRKPGYYSFLARIAPVIMRLLGETRDGKPVFEFKVEGMEFFANVMGQNLRITVLEQVIGNIPYSDKEIVVSVKMKVTAVKR